MSRMISSLCRWGARPRFSRTVSGLCAAWVCSGALQANWGTDGPRPLGAASTAPSTDRVAQVELQGHIVCLPEVMHERYQADLPSNHRHVYSLETTNHTFYLLLETKMSEAIIKDPRVRAKELLLKGRIFPGTQILDVMRTRSVKDNVVYDLFYFCSVCNIESVSPGPCECCQGPVELTEKPLQRKDGKGRSDQP